MSTYPSDARVLAILPDLIDSLEQTASVATVRQRQWAIHQAVEFYARTTYGKADLSTMARVRLDEVLSPAAVNTYLQAAGIGDLRRRAAREDKPRTESTRSTAARAAALRWLATSTGQTPPGAVRPNTALRDTGPEVARDLMKAMNLWAASSRPFLIRTAAVVAVQASTAASSTALTAYTLDDLLKPRQGYTLPAKELTPLPKNFTKEEDETVTALLHKWATPPLHKWLGVRANLVEQLEGSDPKTLFVTCHATNHGQPPGLPLSVRGMTAAYTAALRYLEDLGPGLHPPQTLETLRRVTLRNFLEAGDVY